MAKPPTDLDSNEKRVMFAFSSSADNARIRRLAVLKCVVVGFSAAGLTDIRSENDLIDWEEIPVEDCHTIASAIVECLVEKGFDPPPLRAAFEMLNTHKRVMRLGDLVDAIVELLEG